MTDKILPGLALLMTSILAVHTEAQENTAAASGMTSGLPGVSPARQAELMYVRAQAQKARPEAEAAAMARSAEQTLDKKITERTLEEARETKDLKQKAAYDHQLKRAEDAYKGVSQSEINAWGEGSGTVKVQRGVPPQFAASVPPEEAEAEEVDGRLGFLKAPGRVAKNAASATASGMKKALSWRPFGNDNEEEDAPAAPSPTSATSSASYFDQPPLSFESVAYPAEAAEEKGGFFAKIPFMGGKKNKAEEVSYEAPSYQDPIHQAPPAPAPPAPAPPAPAPPAPAPPTLTYSSPQTQAQTEQPEKAEHDGFLSRMPLIGRHKRKAAEEEASPPDTARNMTADQAFQADASAAEANTADEKPKGFVGRMFSGKKDKPDEALAGSSGLFGAAGNSAIDASLFPDTDGADERLMAQEAGSEKRKLLKAPDLSGIKVPKINVPNPIGEEPKPSLPKVDRSGVHSGGSKNYVVQTPNAQFMRFGDSALNSETLSISTGQVVEMTKAGDEWSSVRLSNGLTGIMRNKDLRPAKPGEGSTASPSPAPGPVPEVATTVP